MTETKNGTEIDSTGKVVLSIRICANEKMLLQEAAASLGITLSDFVETILVNKDDFSLRIDKERLEGECAALKQKVTVLEAQSAILRDPRLLKFYELLKGKSEIVEVPGGQDFPLTYNTVNDVLKSMIYSATLNQ